MKSRTLVLASVCIVVGCSGQAVRMDDRDTSGAHDGQWLLTVLPPTARKQSLPGNWTFTCDWETYDIPVEVADGVMSVNGTKIETPVASSGDFYLAIPTTAEAGMMQGVMSGDASITLLFDGELNDEGAEGTLVQGISNFQNNGCRSKFVTERQ